MAANLSFSSIDSSPGFETPTPVQIDTNHTDGLDIRNAHGIRTAVCPRSGDGMDAFLAWWKETIVARKFESEQTKFTWQFQNRRSKVWHHFLDIAEYPRGMPRAQCKYCSQLCSHPCLKNQGTHSLAMHLQRQKCSGSGQQSLNRNIHEAFKKSTVSILNF